MIDSPYDAFKKNPDGSWKCIKPVTIENPKSGKIQLGVGLSFTRGVQFMGVDIAKWLDENHPDRFLNLQF